MKSTTKIYLKDKNNVFSEVAEHFEVVKPCEADAILTWEDKTTDFTDYAFADCDGRHRHSFHNRLIITFQHGRRGLPTYWHKNTYCLVWSKTDKQEMIKNKIAPPERIFVTGSLIFRKIKPRQKHDGINVVFFPIALGKGFSVDYEITEQLRKLKGVNIITKLTQNRKPEDFINPITSHTEATNHFDALNEVLPIADVVVGAEESTPQLMAQYLDIPTVVVKPKHYVTMDGLTNNALDKRQLQDWFFSKGCKFCGVDDLNEAIKQQIANPNELKEERKQAVIDFGGDVENPLEKTIKTIKEIYAEYCQRLVQHK